MPTAAAPTTPVPLDRPHSPRQRPAFVLALALGATLSTGCYTYQPVALSELTPESTVRLQLSGTAVERLRNGTNNEARLLDDFSVSGKVARLSSDSIVVSVQTSQSSDAMTRPVNFFQPLPLSRSDLRTAEVRRLDRKRTTITATVLTVLSIGAAVYAIKHGGEASGSTPPNGGPNEVRVPLLGFRLP